MLSATPSFAQTAPAAPAEAVAEDDTVVVTGSRIVRDGFDQPTPTTVIGEAELRQGQRPNLAQVLNDSPAFRPSVTPQVSVGNTSSGSAPVDLRGLGTNRTLTLLEGRRFVGNNNLNYVPMSLVERVEVVTGGASAAWGSDAVAGVVNIILKDSFKGVTVGGVGGISTRGDGARYGGDITAGTSFADGRGQIMVTAEYVKDESIPDRNSRDRLGSAGIVRLNPTSTTDLRQILVPDVNYGNQTPRRPDHHWRAGRTDVQQRRHAAYLWRGHLAQRQPGDPLSITGTGRCRCGRAVRRRRRDHAAGAYQRLWPGHL
ncbi:TonB-dependent receptor plug domain-containing protein [Sphingomonas sp. J344]|uniref:TonB-dependent receptor plug domain-containing protein n=1 Tax=Sphingomonas sp. J344 TaxID=2898434 RepID=UPI002151607B|nr:TonB-dependent receptor plug domain-containing protein [Sphingomonas sp. J344]MCR5870213.1 TonB-dependent receptor plug domain-containing protein [Sphingomonas sp. J344]